MNQLADLTPNDVLPGLVLAVGLCVAGAGLRTIARRVRGQVFPRVGSWLLLAYAVELVLVALLVGGRGVWAGLGVAGAASAIGLALLGPWTSRAADQAEARRIAARDCF